MDYLGIALATAFGIGGAHGTFVAIREGFGLDPMKHLPVYRATPALQTAACLWFVIWALFRSPSADDLWVAPEDWWYFLAFLPIATLVISAVTLVLCQILLGRNPTILERWRAHDRFGRIYWPIGCLTFAYLLLFDQADVPDQGWIWDLFTAIVVSATWPLYWLWQGYLHL